MGKYPNIPQQELPTTNRRNTGWLRLSGRRKTDRHLLVVALGCITLYVFIVTLFVVAMVHGEFASYLFG